MKKYAYTFTQAPARVNTRHCEATMSSAMAASCSLMLKRITPKQPSVVSCVDSQGLRCDDVFPSGRYRLIVFFFERTITSSATHAHQQSIQYTSVGVTTRSDAFSYSKRVRWICIVRLTPAVSWCDCCFGGLHACARYSSNIYNEKKEKRKNNLKSNPSSPTFQPNRRRS